MPPSSSYHYSAYGLRIRSFLALPELRGIPQELAPGMKPDVTVRIGEVMPLPCEQTGTFKCMHATPEYVALSYEGIARYLIRDGSEIIVQPAPGVQEHILRIFILGVCLGVLLHQRGLFVLHASAVAVQGRVIAFAGHKGWGKSTTAATLHTRGHPIVADDVVAVQLEHENDVQVYPGFPQLKLWPDAAAASLETDPETLSPMHPSFEKRIHGANHTPLHEPMPLLAIYVLDRAEELGAETMAPQEAFIELLRHSYAAKIVDGTNTSRRHFEQCVFLTQCVPVLRLNRPKNLSALSEVARLVEQQAIHYALEIDL